ncbi:putative formate acetyltransferase 1, partial [Vibrio parahaemolyticus VPTS-2010]
LLTMQATSRKILRLSLVFKLTLL